MDFNTPPGFWVCLSPWRASQCQIGETNGLDIKADCQERSKSGWEGARRLCISLHFVSFFPVSVFHFFGVVLRATKNGASGTREEEDSEWVRCFTSDFVLCICFNNIYPWPELPLSSLRSLLTASISFMRFLYYFLFAQRARPRGARSPPCSRRRVRFFLFTCILFAIFVFSRISSSFVRHKLHVPSSKACPVCFRLLPNSILLSLHILFYSIAYSIVFVFFRSQIKKY